MQTSVPLVQLFNRYLQPGGEEASVDRIRDHLSTRHPVTRCQFDSREWQGPEGLGPVSQAARLFYNPEGRRRFEATVDESEARAALFHNVFPVGSPSVYRAALQRKLPVIHYLHNFRPFSVGGTLYWDGALMPDALHGSLLPEIRAGVWRNSVVKTAAFAAMLKLLHRSGWMRSVKTWITISDFMRDRLIETGTLAPDQVVTMRHAWDAMPKAPVYDDCDYYLFLGRLVDVKGVGVLLDAWDQLHQRLGPKTPPLHIGGQGPMGKTVEERARTNPYICPMGLISGGVKHDQLRKCRALIAPSVWWEPLGLVAYEGFDYAKPVLAARSGGLGEIVVHGANGLLHPPGSVEGLVNDVLTVERMSLAEKKAMGAAGRSWLKREADPKAWLDRFDGILERLIESN
jgi:glycosyltransferase involved in cell wall biosynthesis